LPEAFPAVRRPHIGHQVHPVLKEGVHVTVIGFPIATMVPAGMAVEVVVA